MTVERTIRLLAGTFVLTGLALGRWVDPKGYMFSAFVGLNLLQSSFSGWCPAESILKRTFFRNTPSTRREG